MGMRCLAQGYNTGPQVRIEPQPCDQESDSLPTELLVLPTWVCVLNIVSSHKKKHSIIVVLAPRKDTVLTVQLQCGTSLQEVIKHSASLHDIRIPDH